jgi:hypothetical protein
MLTSTASFLAALLLQHTLGFPFPFLNTTTTANVTSCNTTNTSQDRTINICGKNSTVVEYVCHEVYPSDLTVVNSRYPDYNTSHLHEAKSLFMLRRELAGNGEIATLVQFSDLPSNTTNTSCRLEFVLPRPDLQLVRGFNPTFNVYQVKRATDAIATWETYKGNNGAELFGTVNGEPEALARTRSVGGVAAINETRCNDTLTFQMGMTFNSRNETPNYWEFSEVAPPAWPMQGFRIVYGF